MYLCGSSERESEVRQNRCSKILKRVNLGKVKCGCLQNCPCNIPRGLKVFKLTDWGMKQISVYILYWLIFIYGCFSRKESYTWVYHCQTVEDQRKEKILKAAKQRICITKREKISCQKQQMEEVSGPTFLRCWKKTLVISLYIFFTLSF